MITTSKKKERGICRSEFLAVTLHKLCWHLNKNGPGAGPHSGSTEGPAERKTGPSHGANKTTGEGRGHTEPQRSQSACSGHLTGTVYNLLSGCL